jgi:hypothetical protein
LVDCGKYEFKQRGYLALEKENAENSYGNEIKEREKEPKHENGGENYLHNNQERPRKNVNENFQNIVVRVVCQWNDVSVICDDGIFSVYGRLASGAAKPPKLGVFHHQKAWEKSQNVWICSNRIHLPEKHEIGHEERSYRQCKNIRFVKSCCCPD